MKDNKANICILLKSKPEQSKSDTEFGFVDTEIVICNTKKVINLVDKALYCMAGKLLSAVSEDSIFNPGILKLYDTVTIENKKLI